MGNIMGNLETRNLKRLCFIGVSCDLAFAWGAKGHEFKSRPSDPFSTKNTQITRRFVRLSISPPKYPLRRFTPIFIGFHDGGMGNIMGNQMGNQTGGGGRAESPSRQGASLDLSVITHG